MLLNDLNSEKIKLKDIQTKQRSLMKIFLLILLRNKHMNPLCH